MRTRIIVVAIGTGLRRRRRARTRHALKCEPACRRIGRRGAAPGHAFLHARSRTGVQLGASDRQQGHTRRYRKSASQRQHHECRSEIISAGNISSSLARVVGRHTYHARKFLLPRGGPVISDPLVYVRIVHFAATITVSGVVFFLVFIAEAAFRQADNGSDVAARVSPVFAWIAWLGLVVTVVSGGAWLVLVAQSMSDSSLSEVFSEGILWIVLLQTDFGRDWLARFVLACLLAATFVPFLSAQGVKSVWIKVVAVALAVGVA